MSDASACERTASPIDLSIRSPHESQSRNGLPGPLAEAALFFGAWLRHPANIGAIMPTRAPLARAMGGEAAGQRTGSIVELGGGTGPLTRALLASGISHDRLTVIERNPVFHRFLVRQFPNLRILHADAEQLTQALTRHQVGRVRTIVSSLPRVGWPLALQRSILHQCFAALGSEGVFLEFSYGPVSPVPRILLRELGLVARRLKRVWGNFPPATVWGYRRQQIVGNGSS